VAGYQGDPGGSLSIDKGGAVWWACPNIWVGQPGGTTATEGHNDVAVRFHYDENRVDPREPFNSVQVEVYAYNPGLAPPPGAFAPGGSAVHALPMAVLLTNDFTSSDPVPMLDLEVPPPGPDPAAILAPGHRCLIARVFPFNTVAPDSFDVTEQHSAQRNILLVATTANERGPSEAGTGHGDVGTPGGQPLAQREGWWTFLVDAWNTDPESQTQVVVIDVLYDVDAGFHEKTMGEALGQLGIDHVRNLAPERTGLQIGEEVVNVSNERLSHSMTTARGTSVPVWLRANLVGLRRRTAYALHARQSVIAADRRTRLDAGGATLLFYRAD
jgi:hypothetical protein